MNSIKIANLQTFTVSPGVTLLISSPIDTNGQTLRLNNEGTLVLAGIISGSGRVRNQGGGDTIVAANNVVPFMDLLGTGSLAVAGSQPGTAMSVGNGDMLAGTGTVGPITVRPSGSGRSPTIAPGINGPGILHASNGVTYQGDLFDGPARFAVDLNGTDVGTGYDQLDVTGAVDLHTFTQLSVTIGGGFVPAPGDTFVIIKSDGTDAIQGNFINTQPIPEGSLITVGSTTLQLSYVGGDGNDVTLTAMNGLVSFTASAFSVNEADGTAAITLKRTGGGNTTAIAGLALADVSTSPADYVSPAGKLETSFNPGTPNASIQAVAIQPDGKILIGGLFASIAGISRGHIARLNSDGSLDTAFAVGAAADNAVISIALQPDGKILIGGSFANYDGAPRASIARLNADGSLDTTFNPGTGATDATLPGEVDAILVQSDGKIIIGGSFNFYNGVARKGLARVNANGSLDTSFVPGDFNGAVFDVALDSDGKVLVGGRFSTVGGTARKGVARLNSNGSLDSSFDPGTGANIVLDLAVRPDGKILIGGAFSSYNGTPRTSLARINSDGTLDISFDPGTAMGTDAVRAMAVQPDGRVVVGGDFGTFVRFNPNGTLDPSFNPGAGLTTSASFPQVTGISLQPDGKIVVVGVFEKYGDVSRRNIARVFGDLVATWGPNDFADKTILLPIVNDSVFEGNEQLNLRIVPLTVGVAAPSTAELTILENDPVPTPTPSKALNIATRLRVETGDNVMIAGFIITGNANKDIVLRGRGPVLAGFGISDFLADPVLDLRGSGGSILMNNDWKDTQRAQIEGGPFEPSDDRESAILASLAPGAYTGVLTGNNNTTGVGLIEVFDNGSAADSQLANISTRGLVQGNNSVMIGGFILGGSSSNSRVAIRGVGPSLAQFGLNNVLADPTLELHDGNGALLVSNDDWESDSTSAGQLSANGLGLSDPKESGLFASLPPGAFTAILAGKSGGSGIGLIEIFNLQ